MKAVELSQFRKTDYLREGHPKILDQLRPAFEKLIDRLSLLNEESSEAERLIPFEELLKTINERGDEIETEERESILGAVYEIGSLVGLDPQTQFAEAWRGDW
jgi:hypothetical protein